MFSTSTTTAAPIFGFGSISTTNTPAVSSGSIFQFGSNVSTSAPSFNFGNSAFGQSNVTFGSTVTTTTTVTGVASLFGSKSTTTSSPGSFAFGSAPTSVTASNNTPFGSAPNMLKSSIASPGYTFGNAFGNYTTSNSSFGSGSTLFGTSASTNSTFSVPVVSSASGATTFNFGGSAAFNKPASTISFGNIANTTVASTFASPTAAGGFLFGTSATTSVTNNISSSTITAPTQISLCGSINATPSSGTGFQYGPQTVATLNAVTTASNTTGMSQSGQFSAAFPSGNTLATPGTFSFGATSTVPEKSITSSAIITTQPGLFGNITATANKNNNTLVSPGSTAFNSFTGLVSTSFPTSVISGQQIAITTNQQVVTQTIPTFQPISTTTSCTLPATTNSGSLFSTFDFTKTTQLVSPFTSSVNFSTAQCGVSSTAAPSTFSQHTFASPFASSTSKIQENTVVTPSTASTALFSTLVRAAPSLTSTATTIVSPFSTTPAKNMPVVTTSNVILTTGNSTAITTTTIVTTTVAVTTGPITTAVSSLFRSAELTTPAKSTANLAHSVSPFSFTTVTTTTSTETSTVSKGLGGASFVGTSGSQQTTTSTAIPSVNDNVLPNELRQTVKMLKDYVNAQKSLSSTIARLSIQPPSNISQQVEDIQNSLLSLDIKITRQNKVVGKIKDKTLKCTHDMEIAQKLYYYPPAIEDFNSFVRDYFSERISVLEKTAHTLESEIDETHQRILSLPNVMSMSANEIKDIIEKLHSSFIAVCGALNKVHNEIQLLKVQHATVQSIYSKNSHNRRNVLVTKEAASPSIREKLNSNNGAYSEDLFGSYLLPISKSNLESTFSNSPLNQQTLQSNTPSSSLFAMNQTDQLQLQKPPFGYKRGKR